jgi:hypothetical protein
LTCEFDILRGNNQTKKPEEIVYTVKKEKCLSEETNAWRTKPLITSWFTKNNQGRSLNYYV